jgi:hypothetical protein
MGLALQQLVLILQQQSVQTKAQETSFQDIVLILME